MIDIISRIASGRQNEGDPKILLQVLGGTTAFCDRAVVINGNAERATIATGNGNIIPNIPFQSDGVQIDDRWYRSEGAEVLRAIIQEILRPTLDID